MSVASNFTVLTNAILNLVLTSWQLKHSHAVLLLSTRKIWNQCWLGLNNFISISKVKMEVNSMAQQALLKTLVFWMIVKYPDEKGFRKPSLPSHSLERDSFYLCHSWLNFLWSLLKKIYNPQAIYLNTSLALFLESFVTSNQTIYAEIECLINL